MAADEQSDDETQTSGSSDETKVGHKVVDPHGDTSETPAVEGDAPTQVGARAVSSPEGEESPAEAQRAGEGRPTEPQHVTLQGAPPSGEAPEGTGPGGTVRGGYGVGATGPSGGADIRGPEETGGAPGGQSPAEAQRRGDEEAQDPFAEKPHLYVAGAFVGGLLAAQILKRLAGDD